ncbi:MAG: hypothetical protein IPL40_12610 [Proteobacteria bacterium]|nr:hypothetical protein [Pseudomonadota bacterium]
MRGIEYQTEVVLQHGRAEKIRGLAGYREVGARTVTLSSAPEDPSSRDLGERCPQRLDTVRYARAECEQKALTEERHAGVAPVKAVRPDLEREALADGAENHGRYFDGPRLVNTTQIVDHGHAAQRWRAGPVACYGDTVDGRAQCKRPRIILREKAGGVNAVIAEFRRLNRMPRQRQCSVRRKLLTRERNCFCKQQERMDYARREASAT